MKYLQLFCITLLLFSTPAFAIDKCKWSHSQAYKHLSKYDLPLRAAKKWVKENRTNEYDICFVNYSVIDELHEGVNSFLVFLSFSFEDENGNWVALVGDHVGLYIGKRGELISVISGA